MKGTNHEELRRIEQEVPVNDNRITGFATPQPAPSCVCSREDLFGTFKRRYKAVTLPISGRSIRFQNMSEPELSAYSAAVLSNDGNAKIRRARLEDAQRRLFALCIVNADGDRILGSDDLQGFAQWDSCDAQYLYDGIAPFVGLKRGDLDELVKSSATIPAVA